MVGDSDEGLVVSAVDERRRWALDRSRLFDREAARYDRYRPTYPDALIDELLGSKPEGLHVLDVGCGTGIASRLMAGRGAKVLGVEPAARMADIARGHGIDVEVGPFEIGSLLVAGSTGLSRRRPGIGSTAPLRPRRPLPCYGPAGASA